MHADTSFVFLFIQYPSFTKNHTEAFCKQKLCEENQHNTAEYISYDRSIENNRKEDKDRANLSICSTCDKVEMREGRGFDLGGSSKGEESGGNLYLNLIFKYNLEVKLIGFAARLNAR